MTLPPNTVVIDIWGAPNDLFITTTRGLLRFDGTQWSPIATGTLFLTANVTGVGNSVVFSDVRGGVHQLLRFEPW